MSEEIRSRQNPIIRRLRMLAADGGFRREQGEYLCDGGKLLEEALEKGVEIRTVLWKEKAGAYELPEKLIQYTAAEELFDYASPMKNSPGPLFTVAIPPDGAPSFPRALLLENVQDPGNVGTLIRTAAAMNVTTVLLVGACADAYSPKAVRASMGAIFRERLVRCTPAEAKAISVQNGLSLYGAALSEKAGDIRKTDVKNAVVAIGSEGGGLSKELLSLCDGELIIPMAQGSESLNAAAAGAIILWEMVR